MRDILHHIDLAAHLVAGFDEVSFRDDVRTVYAVTRCLEIVSEASRRLPEPMKARHPSIAWGQMAGAGNIYRHDYEDVAARFVWETVKGDLPALRTVIGHELAVGEPPLRKDGQVARESRSLVDGRLPDDWYFPDIPAHIDMALPGIYEWRIAGIGLYIGKSKRLYRRLREYPNNVRRLILGMGYRSKNPDGYREVHHHLRSAFETSRKITYAILENCAFTELNQREQFWIGLRRQEADSGGPPVLNSN